MKRATNRAERWLLGLVILLGALIYHDLIFWGLGRNDEIRYAGWFFNLSGVSPQLHYLLAAALVYVRRKDIASALHGRGMPWLSLFYLVPGAGLLLWGCYVSATDIVYLSFLLVVLGSACFSVGNGLVRIILLPVLVLALAIPLPAVLINQIVFPFQLWTAEHCAGLLDILGMPASAIGDKIYLAGSSFRVAESCTALGFIKWLTIYAIAYAYLFPVSRLHTLLLVLSAPVIAYCVNLLRVLSLILNPGLEALTIHTAQGIIFFLIGFTLLYALDTVMRRFTVGKRKAGSKQAVDADHEAGTDSRTRRLLVLVFLFGVLFLVSITLPRWTSPSVDVVPEITLAGEIGDWKSAKTPLMKRLFLGSVRYSTHRYRYYTRGDEYVVLFVGIDDRHRRDRSFLSAKNAYQGEFGLVKERSFVTSDALGRQVESMVSKAGHGRILTWYWYEGVGGVPEEILRSFLALDQSPFRRKGGAFVVRLVTPVPPGPDGQTLAEERLYDFIARLSTLPMYQDALRFVSGSVTR